MKSIFVSSTFKDMQAERNSIQFKVTPEINNFLKEYGETIQFTDLRWGIDTTKYLNSLPEKVQEGEEKVLKICLEEIHKTPYFIVILGERYGWIPENKDIVDHVIEVLNKENQIQYALDNKDISVTHLEIDYGAFFRKHPENCLFYFRELEQEKRGIFDFRKNKKDNIYFSQSQEETDRMNKLKARIEQEFPGRTRKYRATLDKEINEVTDLDNFANMIINDVKEIIKRDLKKLETNFWQEKEEQEIKYIINKKAEHFSSQETILKDVDNFIEEEDFEQDILFITGEAGTGKSTLSSRISQLYEEKYDVVPFFIDNTENSKDATDILRYQIYQVYKKIDPNKVWLNKYLNDSELLLKYVYKEDIGQVIGAGVVKHDSKDITIERLQENLAYNLDIYSKISNKKLIFIIDAVDQMQLLEDNEKKYKWIVKEKYPNVKYIITSLKESYFARNPLERMKQVELKELNKEDVINILKYNNKLYAKELSDEVIQKLSKKQGITNFLYLTFVLQRFKMFGKYDYDMIKNFGNDMPAINEHMLDIAEYLPTELEYLCIQVLEYADKIYNGIYFKDILALIANTRYGLREKDIQAIFEENGLEWNSVAFKTILNFLDNYFIIREDERIDFSHRIIREIIKEDYANKTFTDTEKSFNDIITGYLITSSREDMLYVSDLVFHLWKGKYSNITIIEVISSITQCDDKNKKRILAKELWKYFRVTPEWLFEIQEYIASNEIEYDQKMNIGNWEVTFDLDKFDFIKYFMFLIEDLCENMNDNVYEKNIYLDLLRWWKDRLLDKNISRRITNTKLLLEIMMESIANVSDNTEEVLENLKPFFNEENYYIIKAVKTIKKEDSKWFEKRLQWIEELLQKEEIKNNNEIYEELIQYKAETYYFLDNIEKFIEVMMQLVDKYKAKMSDDNKTFEDCKKYLEISKNMYTICGNISMKNDDVNIQKLIDISKEILEWAKSQYREKRNEESKLQLAEAYELVARQYNVLIYENDENKLYPYDTKESYKYIKCITELLSDFEKYRKYLTKVIDYEISILEMKELQEVKNKEIDQYDLKELLQKAKATLKFEDINKYFESLPIVDPIYEVVGYDNIDELIQIYSEANEFIKEYINLNLYNAEKKFQLEQKRRDIHEGYNCLCIAKYGLDEKYISEIVNMLHPYDEEIGKIFTYKAYQYFNEKTFGNRIKIINELEQFTKRREEIFMQDNNIDNITALYRIKRKMYINMIENDKLEKYEDEENVTEGNELIGMKGYLWAIIVRDDIHVANNIYRTYSTLINILKDRKSYLEIDKQRYQQKQDNKILKEIYQAQQKLIEDGYSISSQVNKKSWYEYVLKDLEEIIQYQKSMNYLEKIEEYEQKAEEYKKIIKEME